MSYSKVALITGAYKGLGFEIARQLGQKGITVVVGARDLNKAEAAAKKLTDEGLNAYGVQLEVTNAADVAALPEYFQQKFGRLDILVNNAGVLLDSKDVAAGGSRLAVTAETLRQSYEVNTIAPYEIARTLLPLLKAAPAGRIVNQSSILGSLTVVGAGKAGDFGVPAYTSSKAALNMLTVILAQELKGTKVKVNSVHPGWVQTDMGGADAPMQIEEGAKSAVEMALIGDDGPTGSFQHLGETLPW
jgi:NAD(P)-dependent dehydrogenase (short-subunit alcohol dehydrogenase family)